MTDDPKDETEEKPRILSREEVIAQAESTFDTHYPRSTDRVLRADIGGLEGILDQLEAFKRGIEFPGMYEIMGARPPKGFILSGPPGVGKTMIAKYLAGELGARFVDLPLSSFESKWVGEAEKMLLGHLKNFRMYNHYTGKTVLVFFDEAEEALKSRALQGWHGPRVNVLLREMDGLGNTSGIIFGAATNHIESVDEAILRPGRLDYVIAIPEYDAKGLGDVFRAQRDMRNRKSLKGWGPYELSLEDCERLGTMAHSRGFSPADVAEVYRRVVESRIKSFLNDYDGVKIPREATKIRFGDLERVVSAYVKKGTKPRIGFR